ncbi:MAG: hypothetical protein Q8P18_06370 [Pseudomonadota bacterium]|nr:hypothetical protein [Pseudomonadota bacterium]
MRAPRLGLLVAALSVLACMGGAGPVGPVWPAEPVALVDLPGDEFPTGLALFADGSFATTVRRIDRNPTVAFGGLRFRTRDGGQGPLGDTEPEQDVSADSLAVSPDGARIAVVRYDRIDFIPLDGGEVRSFSLVETLDTSWKRAFNDCTSAYEIVWSGATIALRCGSGLPFLLLDGETGARTLPLEGWEPGGAHIEVADLAIASDGQTLAVLGVSSEPAGPRHPWVELRSLPDGALIRRLTLEQPFGGVTFSPDGARIAVSSPYYGLQILDAKDGHVVAADLYAADPGNRGSGDVLWSPDGGLIYRAGRRLGISVHDAKDARVLGYFPVHPTEPENPMPPPADWPATLTSRNATLELTPDGRFLASIERSDFGRAVRIWRLPAP